MNRGRQSATLAGLLFAVVLVGCAPAGHVHPVPESSSPPEPSVAASPTDDSGAVTAAEIADIAPSWDGGTFRGIIAAPAGYGYGGDCEESARTVLALTEVATSVSRAFQAVSADRPAPSLEIAVVELSAPERTRNLDALQHQLTSCTGTAPSGTTLQEPAPVVSDWAGLHDRSEDQDLYWSEYEDGIVLAQVSPGMASLTSSLATQVADILALQHEVLAPR